MDATDLKLKARVPSTTSFPFSITFLGFPETLDFKTLFSDFEFIAVATAHRVLRDSLEKLTLNSIKLSTFSISNSSQLKNQSPSL